MLILHMPRSSCIHGVAFLRTTKLHQQASPKGKAAAKWVDSQLWRPQDIGVGATMASRFAAAAAAGANNSRKQRTPPGQTSSHYPKPQRTVKSAAAAAASRRARLPPIQGQRELTRIETNQASPTFWSQKGTRWGLSFDKNEFPQG